MNLTKIGNFLKELRKQEGLTQEQLAEQLNVSRRTVSRWETGNNMPDLDILMELSDYYRVDLREILDGERKSENMDKDLEEAVIKVADYSNEVKEKITKRMNVLFIAGLLADITFMILYFTGYDDNFFGGMCLGITTGMMAVGIIMTSRHAMAIREAKLRMLHRL